MMLVAAVKVMTGARAEWRGCAPDSRPRVYFANHRSHLDFVLIWTVLPRPLRRRVRPVAAADYWRDSPVRRFVCERVCRAVLIDRARIARGVDPVSAMAAAFDEQSSLVVFPEGTRNTTEEPLLPFKCGLYHLASLRPDVEFVPVWITNADRVMPKGDFVPVPQLCAVRLGTPLMLAAGEDKTAFLDRCRDALLALASDARNRR